jgi:hypothetical protein
VAAELKQSTVKLCRQLHENPDVAGNEKMVQRHKDKLIEYIKELNDEMEGDLQYETFSKNIKSAL